ncbi:hypothetical protein LEMLEM_LOCUS4059, partial [Lemmus lemmus]
EPLSGLESFSSEEKFLNSETDLQQERGCQGNRRHPAALSLTPKFFSSKFGGAAKVPEILLISFSLSTSFLFEDLVLLCSPRWPGRTCSVPRPPLLHLDVGVAHNAHYTQPSLYFLKKFLNFVEM